MIMTLSDATLAVHGVRRTGHELNGRWQGLAQVALLIAKVEASLRDE